ncbi:SH3 domain-containing protein [uncultured Winogradskyella sp.]|uniref:tetratricopeptide repeat protein n=1 Tax=uncultured Winogradskyella sp. TaxID=395353 RepID=UPI00351360A9
MKKCLLLIIVSLMVSIVFAQNSMERFENANALYNDAKYAEAIDLYKSILDSGLESAELYFNLGNANYKLNNIAPSIFYYEKALLLSPNDPEIKNNLAFAQNMTIDAIDTVPEVGFSKITKNIVNFYTADTWSTIAVAGVFIFVILFLLYHFARVTTKKRVAFIVSIIGLFIAIFSTVMAFQKERLDKKDNPAIVFAQESRVKSDPNRTSEELFRLHEGTKVQVIDSYEDWYKVELADKTVGWVPSQDVRTIK